MIFKNYYCQYRNPFKKEFIEQIKKEGLKSKQEESFLGKNVHKKNLKKRKSKVSWITNPLVYEKVSPVIHQANKDGGWNFQWDWNETAQFTKYGKYDFYDWHVDSPSEPYPTNDSRKGYEGKIRKLSSVLLLSEPGKDFEGGEFEMDFDSCGGEGKKIITGLNKQGSFIVFPSFVRHRVKPVTKGIRHSLVLWHLGLPWK
tara:strand:+ start:1598 stop:2197 length:600 start_codon:yes stop_codon:yes gene_type:complete